MNNQEKFQAMREQLNRLKEKNDQLEAALSNMHQRMLHKDEIHLSLRELLAYVWPSKKNKNTVKPSESR
jgi:hypothetical protein